MKNRADIEVIAAILRSAKDTWELEFLEKHAKLITLFPEIAEPSSQSYYY